MRRHDQSAGRPAAVSPVRQEHAQRTGHPALGRPAAGEWNRRVTGAQQREVAEHVLAVLGPDDDQSATRRIGHRAPGQVGHVREQVAPLGGKQVHEIDVFGSRLEEGRRGSQEVDVRVGGDPASRVQLDCPIQRELEAAGRRLDVDPRPMRRPVEPTDDLDLDRADRQLDREPARDIGVRRRAEDEIAARVLEETRVDLVAMTHGRQVAAIGGGEADPAGNPLTARPIDDLDLNRDACRGQDLDRSPAGRIAKGGAGQHVAATNRPAV